MISRNKYINQLIQYQNNGMPKVITGIRRCGKSYLLREIFKKYLLGNSITEECILVLDLDEDCNSTYRDPIALGNYVREFCSGKDRCYVFLDEIQRVFTIVNPALTEGKHILAKQGDSEAVGFVDVVLGLSHVPNIDLYVTGSNSKMLSTDIVTEFRDKAVNIHISPLSFEEYYNYVGGSKTDAIYEYMQFGGMPQSVLRTEEERKKYLRGLFETTYFKDIIEHNHLRRSESLDELCNILSDATGSLLNSEKIAHTFKSVRHEDISKQTVEKYIGYFEDAFILNEARRYDLKGRAEIGALRKYYFCDTGLRNARMNFAFPDEGQMLENIVYNELIYNDYSVSVGTFDSVEKNQRGQSIRKNKRS